MFSTWKSFRCFNFDLVYYNFITLTRRTFSKSYYGDIFYSIWRLYPEYYKHSDDGVNSLVVVTASFTLETFITSHTFVENSKKNI